MKKAKLVIIATFLGSGYLVAQTKTSPEARVIAPGAPSSALHVNNTAADQSEYFGYDNKIKAITADGTIPVNLPIRKGYALRSDYKNILNEWFKAHNALVKPEFQITLIQD